VNNKFTKANKKKTELKIDLGCGNNKQEGYIGIDRIKFDKVDIVLNLGIDPLPFENDTVDEVYASHFVEHLTAVERVRLFNELYRVMKVGSKMTMIVPHWSSSRAYGDPTHKWPPIGEMWFYYLGKKWRDEQAPHTDKSNWEDGYECDFVVTWGYGIHKQLLTRNQEFQQFALNFYRESVQDIHATIVKQ
jgi:SAM-dependent methyltransferase